MTKQIKFIIIILINVVLVISSMLIYFWHSTKIISRTENGSGIAFLLLVVFFIGSALLYKFNKRLRKYGIGFLSISISIIIHLFFVINKASNNSTNVRCKQNTMLTYVDNGITYFNTIQLVNEKLKNKVTVEQCFEFDSVDIKILSGNFGLDYYSNDINVVESNNCYQLTQDKDLDASTLGVELTKKRCFSLAFEHYSTLINKDSDNQNWYYHRGLVSLFSKKYKSALSDFIIGVSILTDNSSNIKSINISEIIDNMVSNFDKRDADDSILKDILALDTYGRTSDYIERIKYCINKIKVPNTH